MKKGYTTFGSFNNLAKVTAEVVGVWSEILRRVPGARLVLKYRGLGDAGVKQRYLELFAAEGVEDERLDLLPPSSYAEYLAAYHDVDVALDPFPFSGSATTCEALWMGVPVVTCPGETFASRHTLSHLSNVGLTETIAHDKKEYVELAVSLAGDLPRLAALRGSLRERMASSPLCDGKRFAANLTNILRNVCRQRRETETIPPGAGNGDHRIGTEQGNEKAPAKPTASPSSAKRTVLHVGCGPFNSRALPPEFRTTEWKEVRLDIDPSVSPDIVASMTDMSGVPSNSVDAVWSAHNLEHLYAHEVPLALREFSRVLKPGGVAVLIIPDLQEVARHVAEGNLDQTLYVSPAGPICAIDVLFGHRGYIASGNRFMAHKTGFTAKSLQRRLAEAGFAEVKVDRDPPLFALRASATK